MKSINILFFIAWMIFSACNSKTEKRPDTAMDTGRAFIKSSMIGDFKMAETLVYQDAENLSLFNAFKTFYNRMPDDKKQHYQKASYEINEFKELNDSTTLINYSNDYMKKPMEIKLIKVKQVWYVDFKHNYTSEENK
jgi:hypothetical protein